MYSVWGRLVARSCIPKFPLCLSGNRPAPLPLLYALFQLYRNAGFYYESHPAETPRCHDSRALSPSPRFRVFAPNQSGADLRRSPKNPAPVPSCPLWRYSRSLYRPLPHLARGPRRPLCARCALCAKRLSTTLQSARRTPKARGAISHCAVATSDIAGK